MTTMTAQAAPATKKSRAPEIAARVLCVPLAFLTTVGAIVFDGFTTFGFVLVAAAAIYLANTVFAGRSRGVRLAGLAVAPLHFLFNVGKVASGETFSVVFLVLTGSITILLAMSLRDGRGDL